MELIENGKIKRIVGYSLDYWLVTGSTWDYLVIGDNYCTCDHFIVRCLKEAGSICYHILAVTMVDPSMVEQIELSEDELVHLIFRTSPLEYTKENP